MRSVICFGIIIGALITLAINGASLEGFPLKACEVSSEIFLVIDIWEIYMKHRIK